MAKKAVKKAVKKAAKKTAKKASKKTVKKAGAKKYSFLDDILESVQEIAEITKKGEVRIKRSDMKNVLEKAFETAAIQAAAGERVRFPVIGALVRSEVKARKAGKGRNPFTQEEITIKARPASKKPRWSFPKSMKELFANKKNW